MTLSRSPGDIQHGRSRQRLERLANAHGQRISLPCKALSKLPSTGSSHFTRASFLESFRFGTEMALNVPCCFKPTHVRAARSTPSQTPDQSRLHESRCISSAWADGLWDSLPAHIPPGIDKLSTPARYRAMDSSLASARQRHGAGTQANGSGSSNSNLRPSCRLSLSTNSDDETAPQSCSIVRMQPAREALQHNSASVLDM